MGGERNTALGNSTVGGVSVPECELLYALARGVPVGQVIVALNSSEYEAAAWLDRGANEVTGNKVRRVNMCDEDYKGQTQRCKEKVGLLWYNASGEYEDLLTALLSWQRYLSVEARVVLQGYKRPGVARVIREYIGSYGNFIHVESVGTVAVLAVDTCVHHWVIDCNDFGVCNYCGRRRDFRHLRNQSSRMEAKRRVHNRKSK